MLADRSLYVDRSQSHLVPEGSVESAYMLIAKGQTIPAEVVKRLGLRLEAGRVVQGPEPVKEPVREPALPSQDDNPNVEVRIGGHPIMPPESKRSKSK